MAEQRERKVRAPGLGRLGWRLPGTHDIAQHPLYRGELSRWVWRFLTHRMTPVGRWFVLPTLLLGLGLTSLELQAYILFLYVFALWIVALLAAVLTPPKVTLRAAHADRVCAGETLPIELEVVNTSRLSAVDLRVLPEGLPLALAADPPEGVPLPVLKPGEKARVRLGLVCARRGVYALQGYRVERDFPYTLFNAYRRHSAPAPLLVYPQFSPLARLEMPEGFQDHPGGVALKSMLGDSFELLGNREYREGDNLRAIDWRATARLHTPVVREYTREYYLRVGVILDTCVPKAAAPAEVDNFERAVSVCAAVSDHMARKDYLVDIFAAGDQLYHLTAGKSVSYLDQILDILACVESTPREPFSTLEPEIGPLLGNITLVIAVLTDWNPARRDFIEHLLQHGVAVKVIIVRDAPCTLDPGDAPVISREEFARGVDGV